MAGAKSNPPKPRKRVEAETLKRARDGSAFTRCEACNKDVPVVLIDMHSCSLDTKIRESLESQVVEKVVEAKKPEKKRPSPSSQKKKEGTTKKAKKSNESSSKRKRPPTAFFVFMEDFRKEYKEANPDNKSVALVSKEGGEKWKSMTEEEKKPYIEKAAELKAEYEKAVEEDKNAENEEEDKNAENEGEDVNEEQNGDDEKGSSDKEDEVADEVASDKENENED
ncbi:high mobility group B3 [Rhynchospora pubera]|uniref:High mobility group B3 n=1 Tax=Rhynchospora pubera TaxID=906938 RepID=A0AAV8ED85_9POAL|nr:high mobility group B3 [Rhynchospora pubera]